MSFHTDNTMPTYIIFRDTPAGQPLDLNAPLSFWPEKDSDELFDALRAKFPQFKSHSERMRQAVFEYLLDEQSTQVLPESNVHSTAEHFTSQPTLDDFTYMSADLQQLPTPQTIQSANVSPWEPSLQSMSSDCSSWSSPDMLGLATPLFAPSPQPSQSATASQRQYSNAGSVAPSEQSPLALEQMTGVFSLADSTQPKQRVRRKMTEAEKIEYRKRRIVKACDKCSKRKRKCHHNQPEMESAVSNKVTKQTNSSHSSKITQQQQSQQYVRNTLMKDGLADFNFGQDVAVPSFDDFTMLPTDHMPFNDLDDLFNMHNEEWPHGTVDDTLLEFHCGNGLQRSDLGHEPAIFRTSGDDIGLPLQQSQATRSSRPERPRETQQPTHTRHLHESYGIAAQGDASQLTTQHNQGLLAGEGQLCWEQHVSVQPAPSQALPLGGSNDLPTVKQERPYPGGDNTLAGHRRFSSRADRKRNAESHLVSLSTGQEAVLAHLNGLSRLERQPATVMPVRSVESNPAPRTDSGRTAALRTMSAVPGGITTTSASAGESTAQNHSTIYRLSDHFRQRDHFGRWVDLLTLAEPIATFIGAIGLLLWLFSFVPQSTFSISSALCLSLLVPCVAETDIRIHTARTPFKQLWGTDWQWVAWNSSWADGMVERGGRRMEVAALDAEEGNMTGRTSGSSGNAPEKWVA